MNDFIVKPINPESLFATVLYWLQQGAPNTLIDAVRESTEPHPVHVSFNQSSRSETLDM
jgi:hypothetical protein